MQQAHFEGFYEEYFERIYRFVFYRVAGNKELAQDLTQDVFIKAFQAFDRYDPAQSRSAWIYTIARHHVINQYAKQHPQVSLDEIVGSVTASLHPQETYCVREEELGLVKALQELPPEDARLVRMKYLEGWSFAELAEIFEKTAPTLRVQASRALTKLRSLLSSL